MAPTAAPSTAHRGVLAVLATAQFLLILDTAIVNVALASIGRDLHVTADQLTWVVNAYVLTFGGLLLLGGRLSDILGSRRVFVTGATVFAASSLAGALAATPAWLFAARAAQGAGAALAGPAVLALVMQVFVDQRERTVALGVLASTAGTGGAAGLLLGGTLTEWLGWRSVLLVNVPVCTVLVVAALGTLPADRARRRGRFDFVGALTVTAGLSLVVYGVLAAGEPGATMSGTLLSLGTGAGLLGAFLVVEAVSPSPLVPLGFLRHPSMRAANPVAALSAAAMFPMWFLLALYDQRVLGYSPLRTGLAILPVVAVLIVVNTVTPRLLGRHRPRGLAVAGLLVAAAGLGSMSRMGTDYLTGQLPASMVAGLGLGLAFVPVMTVATSGADPERTGLASGLVSVAQQLGGALGLAVLMAASTGSDYRGGLLGAGGFALAGAAAAAVLMRSTPDPDPAAEPQSGRPRESVPAA